MIDVTVNKSEVQVLVKYGEDLELITGILLSKEYAEAVGNDLLAMATSGIDESHEGFKSLQQRIYFPNDFMIFSWHPYLKDNFFGYLLIPSTLDKSDDLSESDLWGQSHNVNNDWVKMFALNLIQASRSK